MGAAPDKALSHVTTSHASDVDGTICCVLHSALRPSASFILTLALQNVFALSFYTDVELSWREMDLP